jgi:hypothetical protein
MAAADRALGATGGNQLVPALEDDILEAPGAGFEQPGGAVLAGEAVLAGGCGDGGHDQMLRNTPTTLPSSSASRVLIGL